MENTKNRILSYDVIRIIAVAMVVLVHSSADFVADYLPPSGDFMWANLLDSISRAGVPLLVMISGALMLNEHKQVNAAYIVRHAAGIAVLLLSWSFIYAFGFQILLPILKHEPISGKSFITKLILGHYHLWFLYMIIGLYLVTPVLRLFVKESNRKYVLYFIALSLLFQFTVPVCNFISNQLTESGDYFKRLMDRFEMGFVSPYLAYYLLGWYIRDLQLTKKSRWILSLSGAAGLAITILGTHFSITESNKAYEAFYEECGLPVFLYSAALYVFLYFRFRGVEIHNAGVRKIITKLSTLSFGVYVLHEAVRPFIMKLLGENAPGCAIPFVWLSVFGISYLLTFLASGIPVIKKLFRC